MGTYASRALKEKRAADAKMDAELHRCTTQEDLKSLSRKPTRQNFRSSVYVYREGNNEGKCFLNSDVLGDVLSYVPPLRRDSLLVVSRQFYTTILESCPPWPTEEELISEWYSDSLWNPQIINRAPSIPTDDADDGDDGGGSKKGSSSADDSSSSSTTRKARRRKNKRISQWEDRVYREIFGRTVDQNCFLELVGQFNRLVIESWMTTGLSVDATVLPPLAAFRLKYLLMYRERVLQKKKQEDAEESSTPKGEGEGEAHDVQRVLQYVEANIRMIILRGSLERTNRQEDSNIQRVKNIMTHPSAPPHLHNLGIIGQKFWKGLSFGADNKFFEGWAKTIRSSTVEDFWVNGIDWDENGLNAKDRKQRQEKDQSSSSSGQAFRSRVVNERTYHFASRIENDREDGKTYHPTHESTYVRLRCDDGLNDMNCCFLYEALNSTLDNPRFIFVYMTADDP